MKIAYVTRSHDGPQGKLNGGYSIAEYLKVVLPELEHITIPQTAYRPGSPELRDMLTYPVLDSTDWSKYAVILFGEWSFAPYFRLKGLRATMLVHSLWTWPDGTAQDLKMFLPFVERAIAPTAESYGLLVANGVDVTLLPYPVPSDRFTYTPGLRSRDVMWVGRRGKHKGLPYLYTVASRHPSLNFHVFVPGPSGRELPLAGLNNLEVHEGRSREECHAFMNTASAIVSTSIQEVYATALIEAAMRGCAVIAPRRIYGTAHLEPIAHLYETSSDLSEILDYLPTLARDVSAAHKLFSSDALESRWRNFIVGELR